MTVKSGNSVGVVRQNGKSRRSTGVAASCRGRVTRSINRVISNFWDVSLPGETKAKRHMSVERRFITRDFILFFCHKEHIVFFFFEIPAALMCAVLFRPSGNDFSAVSLQTNDGPTLFSVPSGPSDRWREIVCFDYSRSFL